MGDTLKAALAAPFFIAWWIAGPVAYVISVVDTWQGRSSIFVKILISLTLDAFLSAIWPVTWLLWLIWEWTGGGSPLSRVLGLF
jgi:hypothetical protein